MSLDKILQLAKDLKAAREKKNYLWFFGRAGWQVTSYDPRLDPAHGASTPTRVFIEDTEANCTDELCDAVEMLVARCRRAEYVLENYTWRSGDENLDVIECLAAARKDDEEWEKLVEK